MTTRGWLRRPVGVVLMALLATTSACGVDDGDVEALEDLPGVERASSSCELGRCTVRVQVLDDIRAAPLGTVLERGRATGAATLEVVETGSASGSGDAESGPRARLELDDDSDPAADARTARLFVDERERSGVLGWDLTRSPDGTRLAASVEPTSGLRWPTGRDLWEGVATLPEPSMVLTTRPEPGGAPSRLVAAGAYPERATDLAEQVARRFGADRLTGVAIGTEEASAGATSVVLAVRSASDADELEALLDDDRPTDDLDVSVVVADNVLEADVGRRAAAQGDDPGAPTEQDRRALLAVLEDDPAVVVAVRGVGLRVRAVGSLGDLRDALERARDRHPQAFSRVPVVVVPDIGSGDPREDEIDLATSGSLDLLDLVTDLRRIDGTRAAGIQVEDRRGSDPEPDDPDAFVSVVAERPDIDDVGTLVTQTARVLARWEGPEDRFDVSMQVEDPDGRSASVILRVDRSGGTWVASSAGRGTEESITLGVRAWRVGA